jgi:hypothetical protein
MAVRQKLVACPVPERLFIAQVSTPKRRVRLIHLTCKPIQHSFVSGAAELLKRFGLGSIDIDDSKITVGSVEDRGNG